MKDNFNLCIMDLDDYYHGAITVSTLKECALILSLVLNEPHVSSVRVFHEQELIAEYCNGPFFFNFVHPHYLQLAEELAFYETTSTLRWEDCIDCREAPEEIVSELRSSLDAYRSLLNFDLSSLFIFN